MLALLCAFGLLIVLLETLQVLFEVLLVALEGLLAVLKVVMLELVALLGFGEGIEGTKAAVL